MRSLYCDLSLLRRRCAGSGRQSHRFGAALPIIDRGDHGSPPAIEANREPVPQRIRLNVGDIRKGSREPRGRFRRFDQVSGRGSLDVGTELAGNRHLFGLLAPVPGELIGGDQASLTGEPRLKVIVPA